MKKIIVAFDGLKFSQSARDYALQLAKMENTKLFGVFLEDPYRHSYGVKELMSERGGSLSIKKKHLDKKDSKTRALAINQFIQACFTSGIEAIVHRDRKMAIDELLHETFYADLLVIDKTETLAFYPDNVPTSFIHAMLPDVQCPVMIVPPKFNEIDRLVLLYDGKASSFHAIKSLTWALSSLESLPAELVTVLNSRGKEHVPGGNLVKEFLQMHFSNLRFKTLEGDAGKVLPSYLKKTEGNPLIVLGAYHRGKLSRWFRPSLADLFMKKLDFPLFIAHT